jgi:hypothetical protein
MRGMMQWKTVAVVVRIAANELLPASRTRGELDVLVVDGYRKVVLAIANRPQRRGTFFSTS